MKHIYTKIVAIAIALSATSCNADWLDVSPSDATDATPAWETITDLKKAKGALTGVYDALQGDSEHSAYYGARMIYYGDVRSDDMQSASDSKRTVAAYFMDYTADTNLAIWNEPYSTIRRANSLLKAIKEGQVLATSTEEQKTLPKELEKIKGQALVARALAHFDLLRVYSLPYGADKVGSNYGIPVITEPLDFTAEPGRNTIKETYDQIEADLKEAIKLISDEKSTGYFNLWAAKTILSRVHLYKGTAADNKKAYDLAAEVIKDSPYTLWESQDYVSSWAKQGTSEVIFEIVNTGTDDWVDREGIAYLYQEAGYSDAIMTKAFVDFAETTYAGDVRLGIMVKAEKGSDYKGKNVFIGKYPGREGAENSAVNNVPILRLSEVYLIASEAAMKLNDAENAAKYLDPIVKRGNPAATTITKTNVSLDRILQENRIEFVGEGHRFFDLIRNDKEIVRYTSESDRGWHIPLPNRESMKFDSKYYRVILPIPDKEMSANRTISQQQNPKY